MKKSFYILILLLLSHFNILAQSVRLKIVTKLEKNEKESVYKFNSANLMQKFVNDTISSLQKMGYIDAYHNLTMVDSFYSLKITKNTYVNKISINSKHFPSHLKFATKDIPEVIDFINLDKTLQKILDRLESNGYGLTEIQLKNHNIINDTLYAYLESNNDKKRKIEDIVYQGYDKFPEGIKKEIIRKFKNKEFTNTNLKIVQNYIDQLSFINQIKAPEVLFEENKTTLYLYLNKNKANKFDGFIGFGTNDEGKLKFNGYLDLNLNNIINKAERTKILWKSDGNKQTTFNFKTEIPYVFKTPVGLDFDINIFRQDSTFQNTNLNYGLSYYINYNTRAKIGIKNITSIFTANTTNNFENFNSKFITISFAKEIIDSESFIFNKKGMIEGRIGFGNRTSSLKHKQTFIEFEGDYNFKLNTNNYIYAKNVTYFLKSENYLINELYRFGGINSLRGFNENSIQGNSLTSLMIEYRYVLNDLLYLHSITDFAYIKDIITNNSLNAYSFGFGLGLITKNGLFKLNYANGNTQNTPFKLKNSLFHLSLNTIF